MIRFIRLVQYWTGDGPTENQEHRFQNHQLHSSSTVVCSKIEWIDATAGDQLV
jgi:hypothetical protein